MTDCTDACIALTTTASRAQAVDLARAVVNAGLAACVQLLPIHSVYVWQGKLTEDDEHLLLIKTRVARWAELDAFIHARHGYDTPELVRLPIAAGSPRYLDWLAAATTPDAATAKPPP